MQRNGIDQFNSKWKADPQTGCWLWTGYVNDLGYGRFRMGGKKVLAHRASWEIHRGTIPLGMLVCHKCDVPGCVNPNHLFLGTVKDNAVDMATKGRQKGPHGDEHHSAKLTKEKVLEIREKFANGIASTIRLAEEYGVSKENIRYVVARKTWRHI